MAVIKITNSDEFKKLLDVLGEDIIRANIFFQLYKGLLDSTKDCNKEMNYNSTFWGYTIQSNMDAVMLRILRIYDQNQNSLNLRNFLDTIKYNISIFDEKDFKERLKKKHNPFAESLAEDPRKPDSKKLDNDIEKVSNSDPIVEHLEKLRHNIYFHKAPPTKLTTEQVTENWPVSYGDIETLLNRAYKIFNHYSSLFEASVHSRSMSGIKGHEDILKAVRFYHKNK